MSEPQPSGAGARPFDLGRWVFVPLLGAFAGLALAFGYAFWDEAARRLIHPDFFSPRPSVADSFLPLLALAGFLALAAISVAAGAGLLGASWRRVWFVALLSGILASLVISVVYATDWELPRDIGGRYLAFYVFAIFVAITMIPPFVLHARRFAWLGVPLGILVVALGGVGDRLYFALRMDQMSAPIVMLAYIGIVAGVLCSLLAAILHRPGSSARTVSAGPVR